VTTVTVYHNVSRDASFGLNAKFFTGRGDEVPTGKRSYLDEKTGLYSWKGEGVGDERHELVRVYQYEASQEDVDNDNVTARAWDAFNNVGGEHAAVEDPAYFARRLRSLSVGDVLAIDYGPATQYWSVDSFGFRSREEDELRVLTAAQAERVVRERYQFKPAEQLSVTVPLAH